MPNLSFDQMIDELARELYETHWGPNPQTGKHPPKWDAISYETRVFVRKQAFKVAKLALEFDWAGTEFENLKVPRERSIP